MLGTTLDAIKFVTNYFFGPGESFNTVNYKPLKEPDPQVWINHFRELKASGGFTCPHCGCPKTMPHPTNNTRLCVKCCEPVFVYTDFVDVDADWKHSRGPWRAIETKDGKITIESETKVIATLYVDSIKKARFDSELMASAPEILHWLNEIIELVKQKVPEKQMEDAIVNALFAIAKAERWGL